MQIAFKAAGGKAVVELYILEPWWAQTLRPALSLPSCTAVGEQGEGLSWGHFRLLVLAVAEQPNGRDRLDVSFVAICCSLMMSAAYISVF